jgi:large subunit ribosomal protein L23
MDLARVLIAPIVTEKSYQLQDLGKYVFRVHPSSTKIDVKKAVQLYFGTVAHSVNLTGVRSKFRKVGRGRLITKRKAMKKATVSLGKGVKLDLGKLTAGKK